MMEYKDAADQFSLLGIAVICGGVIGVFNSCFSLIRKFTHPSKTMLIFLDVLFWFSSAVGLFFVTVWFCDGYVRVHFVATALIGFGVYSVSIGSLVDKVADFVIIVFRRCLAGVGRLFGKYFRPQIDKILCLFTNFFKKLKKYSFFGKKLAKTACNSQIDNI